MRRAGAFSNAPVGLAAEPDHRCAVHFLHAINRGKFPVPAQDPADTPFQIMQHRLHPACLAHDLGHLRVGFILGAFPSAPRYRLGLQVRLLTPECGRGLRSCAEAPPLLPVLPRLPDRARSGSDWETQTKRCSSLFALGIWGKDQACIGALQENRVRTAKQRWPTATGPIIRGERAPGGAHPRSPVCGSTQGLLSTV